jgi:hypothetical protein
LFDGYFKKKIAGSLRLFGKSEKPGSLVLNIFQKMKPEVL